MQMANRVGIITAGVAEGVWILTGTRTTHQNWEEGNFQKQDKNFNDWQSFCNAPPVFY